MGAVALHTGRVLVVGCGDLAAELCALGVDATSDDGAASRAELEGIDLVILDSAAEAELVPVLAGAFPALLTLVLDPSVSAVRVSAYRGPAQDSPVVRLPEGSAPSDLLRWVRAASHRAPALPPRPL
jgi:hypothetical protein